MDHLKVQDKAFQDWFANQGDKTHRLNYDLKSSSIVFDVGAYNGRYAKLLNKQYDCEIYCFEPVEAHFNDLVNLCGSNSKFKCLKYGIGPTNCEMPISIEGDASSVFHTEAGTKTENIVLRNIEDVLKEHGLSDKQIDLLKINIEGGEFDLLDYIIDHNLTTKFTNIQVQFHNFYPDCWKRHARIKSELQKTHQLTYDYYFVWENWELK